MLKVSDVLRGCSELMKTCGSEQESWAESAELQLKQYCFEGMERKSDSGNLRYSRNDTSLEVTVDYSKRFLDNSVKEMPTLVVTFDSQRMGYAFAHMVPLSATEFEIRELERPRGSFPPAWTLGTTLTLAKIEKWAIQKNKAYIYPAGEGTASDYQKSHGLIVDNI